MDFQIEPCRWRKSAVIVAGDDAADCARIVTSLGEHGISAHRVCGPDRIDCVSVAVPRVVICRPGATGLALFHALNTVAHPPAVVVLSDAPWSRDEVHCDDGFLVIVIRMPVVMRSLAAFIRVVLGAVARLDRLPRRRSPLPAGAVVPPPRRRSRGHLRVVH